MKTPHSTTLSKALRLLRVLAEDGGRSNLSSLAKRAAIPLATAHRLAATLEAETFIERQAKGRFAIGEGVRALVPGSPPDHLRLIARLRQPLDRIALRFGAILHFGVLEEGMVTYLVKANGTADEVFTEEAMQLEAYCSAIGKILLAALPTDELDGYLAFSPFVALTSNTITNIDDLRCELELVRRTGVAYDRFEIHERLYCVAVPVRDQSGAIVGGMSASFVGDVPSTSNLRPLLQAMKRLASNGLRSRR